MNLTKQRISTADGSSIYYEKTGTGSPLFLLHGNGGNGQYFSKQIPFLRQHFQLFIVDSRGHGQSTNCASQLSFQLMAADLWQIFQEEQLQQADILGFSDGANLAMVFAKLYPQAVHRLILNSGNTTFNGLKWYIKILSYIEYGCLIVLAPLSKHMKQFKQIHRLLLDDIGVSEVDLQHITAPALIIVGSQDIITEQHSIYIKRQLPHAKLVLIHGHGHTVAQKAPEQFNQEVFTFLKEEMR